MNNKPTCSKCGETSAIVQHIGKPGFIAENLGHVVVKTNKNGVPVCVPCDSELSEAE